MGGSIADIVVLNGTTTTYEVKTDLDHFSRLSTQLIDYTSHTEHVFVVVSEKRAVLAEQQINDSVGILALRQNGALSTIRPSSSNLSQMSVDNLYLMLRTSEAADLLRRAIGYEADVPTGHLWLRMRELFREFSIEVAHQHVLTQLRHRSTNAFKLVSNRDFPHSMRALAYGTELSGIGVQRVHERLSSKASIFLNP